MKRRCEEGYILVETIVALGLLSICMVVIQASVRQAILTRGQAEDFTTARFLMEQQVADKELQPEIVEGAGEGTFAPPHERFNYAWNITKVEVPLPAGAIMPAPNDSEGWRNISNYVARYEIVVSWSRAGQPSAVTGITLFSPDKLWVPERTNAI